MSALLTCSSLKILRERILDLQRSNPIVSRDSIFINVEELLDIRDDSRRRETAL